MKIQSKIVLAICSILAFAMFLRKIDKNQLTQILGFYRTIEL